MAEPQVRRISHADLPRVVEIHKLAFPDSALTAFGAETLRRYYVWLLEGPHDAVVTGAWIDDKLLGFCAAGVFRGAMNGFLRANRPYLASRVLRNPSLLASPLIRDRIRSALAITVRFSRLARARTSTPAAVPSFGVLSIATDPRATGLGVGRALMREAEERATRLGHPHLVLTVHPENTRAVTFYEQLGWSRTLTSDGRWTGAMRRNLPVEGRERA